jgi:elongation factor G
LKQYQPNDHRNVALIGHGGSGKTSLAEAMLFRAKAVSRAGSVSDGTSVMDYLPEEHKRQGSVALSVASFEYGNRKITLIDTPGFPDFEAEVVAGLHAAGAVVLVVSADAGMEVGSELTWKRSRVRQMPAAVVVNAMDKEQANPEAALASVREKIGSKAVAMQIPIGTGDQFTGVVDVLRNQAFLFKGSGAGEKGPVPAEMEPALATARASLMENAAESSEELMNKYFEEGELSQEDLIRGIHEGIAQGDLYPVFFTSASAGHGMTQLLDGIVDILPGTDDLPPVEGMHPDSEERESRPAKAEGPLAAMVFKTMSEPHVGEMFYVKVYSGVLKSGDEVFNATQDRGEKISQLFAAVGKNRTDVGSLSAGDIGIAVELRISATNDTLCDRSAPIKIDPIEFPSPVIDFAIKPTSSGDEDKMGTGLGRLTHEDPTLTHHYDEETRQTLVSGLGDTHLELMVSRLKDRFGVQVDLTTPRVPYRETIRGRADVQGRYKKQTGGRGQFGDVHIKFEPAAGEGFQFVNKIVGGAVPSRFIPAVEKGIRESMVDGVLAGYPMVDFKATLYDGSYHSVDSSEAAFKVAGSMAFKKGTADSQPTILEPFWHVTWGT